MDVLVYNGPGVSQTSLQHTLSTLRAILTPNYTVQTITPHSVKSDPWEPNCALFVLPGGRDLPFVSSLKDSSSKIREYVQNGGKFLGLCAGAYYACSTVEWEVGTAMEVSGERPLGFFKGVGKGCVYPGFQYETELGARAVSLKVTLSSGQEKTVEGIYYNGGGEFVAAKGKLGISVIGEYLDGEGRGKTAGVFCQVGKGRVVLWAVHPEYPLTLEPALSAIKSTYHSIIASGNLSFRESQRWELMEDSLRTLGLDVPKDKPHQLSVLPQFLTSTPFNEQAISILRDSEIAATLRDSPLSRITGHSDKFEIRNADDSEAVLEAMRSRSGDSGADDTPKQIIVYPDGVVPPKELTPHFDLSKYFADLDSQYKSSRGTGNDEEPKFSMGEILLYGEVVTSTQTLLDKNPTMTTLLPTPLISIASFQISGRGRGSNIWLSPSGCLQFSLLLRVSRRNLPPSKLVFIQYLFGLAVVEACNSDAILGDIGKKVRLKWPNDIYAAPDSPMGLKKIGGILVNTSFTGDIIDIVVGCGLNVLTRSPITSLSHLVPPGVKVPELSLECTAAAIMVVFNGLWSTFLQARGSFEPFMDSYLQNWLHSDQVVTLTTQDPHIPVRIVGITQDYGFLRTLPERRDRWSSQSETYIDLQPDGNSFDLMAGLIKTKQ